jgi:hypothetical protein
MELVDGIPHLRVSLGSDNITVTGDVNIATEIKINNTDQQSIPVHLTDDPIGVTGQFWQATQPVSIASMPTTPVTGQFWQATQPVSIASLPNITGSVSVSNFPGIQAVSGNFYPETQPVSIASMPTTPVTGTFWPATQNVSGTVELGATTLEALENTTVNIGTMPEVEIKNDTGNPIPISATTAANSLSNPISIQITKNGLAVSDTVALPTRVLNDEALIAYARGAAVTETDVLNAYLIDKSGATAQMGVTPETMTTVWGGTGLYPWNTFTGTGAKIYIKSVTNDPKVQGKSVTIEGLDSNYDILIETVTLHATDTTTPVSTVNNFYRTNKMYLSGANTNSLPHDYNIELRYGSSSGTLVGQMNAPWGRGQNCFYTVPRGHEGFVLSINGNSGKADEITSSLWFHPYGGTWTLQKSFKFISGMFDHNFRTPLRITEKSDVEIRAYALVESSRIGTEFQMLVLPKV